MGLAAGINFSLRSVALAGESYRRDQQGQPRRTEVLGAGDIDRIIIESRSLLRQSAHAPDLEWARWRELQAAARAILRETESPTLTDLPRLDYQQTRRVDHCLQLRRH